jgi:hypothetical protein
MMSQNLTSCYVRGTFCFGSKTYIIESYRPVVPYDEEAEITYSISDEVTYHFSCTLPEWLVKVYV